MKVAEDMRERASERIKGWLAELAACLHLSQRTHARTHRQNRNKNEDKWAYVGCYNIESCCCCCCCECVRAACYTPEAEERIKESIISARRELRKKKDWTTRVPNRLEPKTRSLIRGERICNLTRNAQDRSGDLSKIPARDQQNSLCHFKSCDTICLNVNPNICTARQKVFRYLCGFNRKY
jgi:hypothetical protein